MSLQIDGLNMDVVVNKPISFFSLLIYALFNVDPRCGVILLSTLPVVTAAVSISYPDLATNDTTYVTIV